MASNITVNHYKTKGNLQLGNPMADVRRTWRCSMKETGGWAETRAVFWRRRGRRGSVWQTSVVAGTSCWFCTVVEVAIGDDDVVREFGDGCTGLGDSNLKLANQNCNKAKTTIETEMIYFLSTKTNVNTNRVYLLLWFVHEFVCCLRFAGSVRWSE